MSARNYWTMITGWTKNGKIQIFFYLFVFFYFYTEVCWNGLIRKMKSFLLFINFILGLVFWLGLGDPSVSQYMTLDKCLLNATQQPFVTLRQCIDVFTTTVLKGLRLKFQSDPRCNLVVRKSNGHTKHVRWFASYEVYLLLPHLVVAEERET